MTDSSISSAPPPYSLSSGNEAKSTMFATSQRYPESIELLQQPQYPLSPYLRKYDFPSSTNPSTQSSVEPIIMPIMMPQATAAPYPCQQPMSDKPINVVVNADSKAERNSFARDYRICNFCKRGIMKRKK